MAENTLRSARMITWPAVLMGYQLVRKNWFSWSKWLLISSLLSGIFTFGTGFGIEQTQPLNISLKR